MTRQNYQPHTTTYNPLMFKDSDVKIVHYFNPEEDEENDYDDDENEDEDLEWSQTSWERNSNESEEDYLERMEDLDNFLDGF